MKNFFDNERHNETANNHFDSILLMLQQCEAHSSEFAYAWDMFRSFMDHFRYKQMEKQAAIEANKVPQMAEPAIPVPPIQ